MHTISLGNQYGHVSVLPELAKKFNVGESEIGGIMGIFYISVVSSSLVYGYLGDRYNRKIILTVTGYLQALGVFLCGLSTTMPIFYAAKILIGLTQSAFITIVPGVLSDVYSGIERTKMLGLFYTSEAFGAGVGIIGMGFIASKINIFFGFTSYAIATAVFTTLYLFFVPNYKRVAAVKTDNNSLQQSGDLREEEEPSEISIENNSSICQDLLYLCKNKTYLLTIFAFALTSAVAETALIWIQELLRRLLIFKEEHSACIEDFYFPGSTANTTIGGKTICNLNNTLTDASISLNQTKQGVNCVNCSSEMISTYFGLISIICGIVGVMIGILLAQKLIEQS